MKKQLLNRFGFIESNLFWEEGITASKLMETFEISRPAAQKVIDDYRRLHPGQMLYNPKTKRHEASVDFKPYYVRTDNPMRFLDYLRGDAMVGHYRDEAPWSGFEVVDVNRFLRPSLPLEVMRTILSSLKNNQAVLIDYRKKDLDPSGMIKRVISPNHLVFADNRYHIRGYCHKQEKFRDFVLSRIVSAEISQEYWVPPDEDLDWNELIEIHLIPNPELSENVRNAIVHNFAIVNDGKWVIKCRQALLFYIKRRLAETPEQKYGKPLWQIIKTVKVL